jgi:Tol biopolymer transport system component
LFIGKAADGERQLWLRSLDSQTAEPLAGTELVESAFWAPDSHTIAFFAAGKLNKISSNGGASQTICDAPVGRSHGSWSRNGTILFDTALHPEIYRVAAHGGEPKPATSLDVKNHETLHSSPQFLPDGRHFVYFVQSARPENTGIYVASAESTGSKRLLRSGTNAVYAGTLRKAGYLLFTDGNALMSQSIDLNSLEMTGEPLVVAPSISIGIGWGLARAAISASENGVLTYRTRVNNELVWLDRQGKRLGVVGEPADYSNPSLSPDEKKLMVSRMDGQNRSRDLWLFDLQSGTASRFTFDPADETDPVWSPDASRVAFNLVHNGIIDIYQKLLPAPRNRRHS